MQNHAEKVKQEKISNAKNNLLRNVVNRDELYTKPDRKCQEIIEDGITFYLGYRLANNRYNYFVEEYIFETIEDLNNAYVYIEKHFELQLQIEIKIEEFNKNYSHVSNMIDELWSKNKTLAMNLQSCRDRTRNQIYDGNFDTSELDNLIVEANGKIDINKDSNLFTGSDVFRFTTDKKNKRR